MAGIASAVPVTYGTMAHAMLLLLTLTTALVFHAYYKPYISGRMDWLETGSLSVTVIAMGLTALMVNAPWSQTLNYQRATLWTVLLLLTSGFVSLLGIVLYSYFKHTQFVSS